MHSANSTLIFCSSNDGKLSEMQHLAGNRYIVKAPASILDRVVESGTSYEENAAIKARAVWSVSKRTCFADDSGLACTALDGAPGIHSARYSEMGDLQNIQLLLERLNGKDRSASFICVLCLIENGNEYYFKGSLLGTIAKQPVGYQGFGYDSLFIPAGSNKTLGQTGQVEKNQISHRAVAMQLLLSHLNR